MTVIVSSYDKRRYSPTTLSNGLEVLIVEDDTTKKSAVSMTVAAGHFNDPSDCPGLAHLLEHMMFMGSESFSEPNHLNNFLNHHNGQVNAWTGTEHTNYYFDCATQALPDAIHIFANMLLKPSLTLEAITKESQSIHAEFELKLKDDLRRLYQVHKQTCNPAHPFSKFSVGNRHVFERFSVEELSVKLRLFHHQWYNANHCKLCVITSLPYEEAKATLATNFEKLLVGPKKCTKTLPTLYLPEQIGIQIGIKPIKEAKRLIVTFVFPGVHQHYRSKPLDIISAMLGDEGSGSLLSYFKAKGWATNLSAGSGIDGANFKDFNINLQLTSQGLNHKDDILRTLFQYIDMMKTEGMEHWRVQERADLNKLAFDFRDKEKPLDYAMHLSTAMHHYPLEHTIIGDYILDKPNIALATSMLDLMIPQNMRIKLIHDGLETDQTAEWYGTKFRVDPITPERLEALSKIESIDALKLPKKNPFVVTRIQPYDLENGQTTPTLLNQSNGFRFWFGQDSDFRLPKGDLYMSFESPIQTFEPEIVVLRSLWVAICQEQFHQKYYQSTTAGLNGYLYTHQGGFSIHTNGFSDKQIPLAKLLIEHIHTSSVDSTLFEQIKAKQTQSLKNSLLNKPLNLLFGHLSVLLQRNTFLSDDKLPILNRVTPEDIQNFKDSAVNQYQLEALLFGDWRRKEATEFSNWIYDNSKQKLVGGDKVTRDVTDLRQEFEYFIDVYSPMDEAAIVVYYQAQTEQPLDTALFILAEQALSAPFFNHIRTVKQLGYVVGSGYFPFNQHPGIAFYIQSPNASVDTLYNETISSLKEFNKALLSYPEDQWLSMKHSVINQLSDKDSNLSIKSQRLWVSVSQGDLNNSHRAAVIRSIESIELKDLAQHCYNMLESPEIGRIVLYCRGKDKTKPQIPGAEINDIRTFKSQASYIR
jgi:secreted Zn-dependent insulinase-like peptidase